MAEELKKNIIGKINFCGMVGTIYYKDSIGTVVKDGRWKLAERLRKIKEN